MLVISYFSTEIKKLRNYWSLTNSWDGNIIWSSLNKPDNIWWMIEFYDENLWNVINSVNIQKPMALYDLGETFLCSTSKNNLLELTYNLDIVGEYKNSLFNSIHSISTSGMSDKLVLTSTWIDTVIEYDYRKNNSKVLWTALNSKYWLFPNGVKRIVNFDSNHSNVSYPTLLQTTHLNSSILLNNILYVSLFHQWKIIAIDIITWKSYELFKDLFCPHGFHYYYYNWQLYFIFSDSKNNKVYYDIVIENFKVKSFKLLDDNFNWVQDAKIDIETDKIYVLDSNNHKVSVYSYLLLKKEYDYYYWKDRRIYDLIIIKWKKI